MPNGPRSRPPPATSGTRSPPSPKPRPASSRSSSSIMQTWKRPVALTATRDPARVRGGQIAPARPVRPGLPSSGLKYPGGAGAEPPHSDDPPLPPDLCPLLPRTNSVTFDDLQTATSTGQIDTVLTCMVDMQGRLMGKRFHAEAFLEIAEGETQCCNYLLATDLDMATPDGYAATSWSSGYGDYIMKPDLATLRRVPWLDGTALVLCDVLDHHSHAPVAHAPREILKRQV